MADTIATAALSAFHPDWSHTMVLPGEPPSAFARAFVSRHLVEHALFQLVDIVRLVAGELATHPALDGHRPLRVSLSGRHPVVTLRVDQSPSAGTSSDQPLDGLDAWYASRAVGLLNMTWGARIRDDDVAGLWATFDASRHRHAIDSLSRSLSLHPGQPPKALGVTGPG